MRKKDDTLRGTLLDLSREIADTEGIDAVNIRSIAKRAGVATGTVYNYFSNKDEILLALTEEYWKQTLIDMRIAITADSFCGQLQEIFEGYDRQTAKRPRLVLVNYERHITVVLDQPAAPRASAIIADL